MANKTYQLMHEHLLATAITMLQTVPFAKLSIKAFCENANVNRNTFYRHFDDKYHLLEDILRKLLREFTKQIDLDQFVKAPFTNLKKLKFDSHIEVLEKQLKDPIFESTFDTIVFKLIFNALEDQNLIWLIGKIYVVRLWNEHLEKPYDMGRDYRLLDQIIQSEQFPSQ
ncbi:TetR/AcrR family transcriptional regulator [Leuconostocaceae bacterium ESL0958]|nr:TetR/AcrR family transcriptional regulator [Leuconostocaceae bacterium ESL0958]